MVLFAVMGRSENCDGELIFFLKILRRLCLQDDERNVEKNIRFASILTY